MPTTPPPQCIAATALYNSSFDGTTKKSQTTFAPARVNLIGEHTDYTSGHVLPLAISNLGTGLHGVGRIVDDASEGKLSVVSSSFEKDGVGE